MHTKKKQHRKMAPPARRHKPKHHKPRPQTYAIVQHGRTRELTADETKFLRETCAKGTDDNEFRLFMQVCKKSKLDPFLKQIYCVIFTGEATGRSMVIITGIGGFRTMAARDHKDYGGTSDAQFTWPETKELTPAKRRIPFSATVTAYRKGGQAGSATVYWEEFAPKDLSAKRSDFWNRMPKHMLAKCAESHALRKMFPGLSNIFTEEEMSAALQDFTPEGRRISVDGKGPGTDRIIDRETVARKDSQEIADAKTKGMWCEKHKCRIDRCPVDEHSDLENEAAYDKLTTEKYGANKEQDARLAAAKNITPKQTPEPIKEEVVADLWPKNSPGKQEADPGNKSASGSERKKSAARTPAPLELLQGTMHGATIGATTERKVPYVNVKINQKWYTCWHKSMHPFLMGRNFPVVVEVFLNKTKAIDGLKRIGDVRFDVDMKTPVVPLD